SAFADGARETWIAALSLRNAVFTQAPPGIELLSDLHEAVRKAALANPARQRLLADFEIAFSVLLEERARDTATPEPRDLFAARLTAAEEAYEAVKPVKGDAADQARQLRNLLNEERLPPRQLVAAVGEALLDALMKPAPGQDAPKIREACKKFEAAFSEMGV